MNKQAHIYDRIWVLRYILRKPINNMWNSQPHRLCAIYDTVGDSIYDNIMNSVSDYINMAISTDMEVMKNGSN